MDCQKLFSFHFLYTYTYFITIAANYRYNSVTPFFQKFKNYAHGHDRNSHIFSVKEYTTKAHGLHYHILYFTNKKLDYSKVHEKMPKHADINIQLVPKTRNDIKKVFTYMMKSKK